MTKESMIKVLRYKAEHIKTRIKPEFFLEVADALEQQSEDAISRQETINYLNTNMVWYDEEGAIADSDEKLKAITDLINGVPPVTPMLKTEHWIPVSERLPEIRQNVLCQCQGNICSVLRLNHNGDWECIYPHTTYMQSFVIAWMPLPEPFEPQEE